MSLHRIGFIMLALSLSFSAHGASPASIDVKPVQSDTTDVFQVLTTLSYANSALERRDFIQALQAFESVLLHDPKLKPARAGLRRTLIALGNPRAAEKWIDDPQSADAIIIAVLLGQVEEPDAALKVAIQSKSDPRLWTLLGRVNDGAGNPSAARQAFAMAGLAGARAGLADNNIGQSHWAAGEYELALVAFNAATRADPLDMQFDNNRRRALIALGRTQDAVEGLNDKRAGVFLAQAGDQATSNGDIKLAKFLYRKSLTLSPRHNSIVAEKLKRLRQHELEQ